MDDEIQYLSEESLAALKKELETMETTTIPDIAKRIDEAKQQGDLSENAEYHQAREDMSWAQGRLLELQHIVTNARIIENKQSDVVAVGSTVVVKVNGKEKEYTIVGPQEVDPAKGKISNESPLGEAFIGHKAGDKVDVHTPAGKLTYEIRKIQ